MQYLPSGSNDDFNNALTYGDHLTNGRQQSRYAGAHPAAPQDVKNPFSVGQFVRKYWLLLVALMILGAAAGFISVVLSSPLYRSRLLVELQNPNGGLLQGNGGSTEATDVDIQTQVNILKTGSFLTRAAARMQGETPIAPTGRDLFSRLRERIHPAIQDPLETARTGLFVAVTTFDARPVMRTRLIELSCQSTSPDVAAQFLNAMAAEFKDDSSQSRSQTALRASEWVATQIEETKTKVQDAEDRLSSFVQASGNIFAGQDATLDDAKLSQLKAELTKINSVRIALQTRYELTLHYPPEHLGEILDDAVVKGYQLQIEGLKREKAVLLTTFTEKHDRVRKVNAQLEQLQKAYETETTSVLKRIKHDYEAAVQQESLLSKNYAGQSQRVGSEAGKVAQYNALRREVDTQRQMYQGLMMQQNQTNLSNSVPVTPIRVVEQATPADAPYKPRPVLNISFGTMFGLILAAGLGFLRDRMDRSIRVPGLSRQLFNAPELGVIPNIALNGSAPAKRARLGAEPVNGTNGDATVALVPNNHGDQIITESFRSTLASILRNQVSGRAQQIILVTSPGPSEGKTTVVQNLGIVLAETGRKVLLVDADFRRPHLHRKFALPNEIGLIDLLSEDTPLSEYSPERYEAPTGIPGLTVFPNRVTQNNVAKALYSPRLRAILETLSKRYDMILVDAPPILSVADARIIAPLVDALILVLRCGVTDRENALEAYQRIQEDGLTLLGTVLTDYNLSGDRRRRYYYDYEDASRS